MSTTTAEEKGVETEIKKEEVVAETEAKPEEVAVATVALEEDEDEGECDCEECQGGVTGGFVEYEEEGGWIDEFGVDDHDFY
jgi:hypothetical protein